SLALRPIAREEFVVALPAGHRLAAGESVAIGELRAEDFIMYTAGSRSVVNDAVIRACLAAGFHPQVAHESSKTSTQLSLVAAGLGVAVLPESVRSIALDGVQYRAISGTEPVELGLSWRRNEDSPLVDSFLAMLEDNNIFIDSTHAGGSRENHSHRGDPVRHPLHKAPALRERRGPQCPARPGARPQ
ncbi:HTH-type transcriptional regulator TtuA, partial [Arthrobacter sp. Hiyo6]